MLISGAAKTASNGAPALPPTMELAEGASVSLPALSGKTVREVIEICERLGLSPVLVGSGIAQAQQPEAGASMRRGGMVTIRFGRATEVSAMARKRNK